MTADEYWGAVRALGLRNFQKVPGQLDFIAAQRDGTLAVVPDPDTFTAEERAAIIDDLNRRYSEF